MNVGLIYPTGELTVGGGNHTHVPYSGKFSPGVKFRHFRQLFQVVKIKPASSCPLMKVVDCRCLGQVNLVSSGLY